MDKAELTAREKNEGRVRLLRLLQLLETDSDAEHIADSIRAAGFDQATRMAAEGYLDKARAALATLPSGPEQDILQQMADYVRDRKK